MKRLGPELKMPKRSDLKVPPVVSDLYCDLRDRRLLPIVALLVVAIVAAPILLSGGSSSPGPRPAPVVGAAGNTAKGTQLTVVQAQPGLRSPNQRFAHRKPTDPFKQRFTGSQTAKAEANAVKSVTVTTHNSSSSAATGGEESPPVVSTPETSTEGGGAEEAKVHAPSAPGAPSAPAERGGAKSEGGGGGSHESSPLPEGGSGEIHYYSWTAKIRIAHTETAPDGSTQLSEPELRESVKTLTPLPGQKRPILTFIGVDTGTGGAVFVVSKEVTAMYGEGKCLTTTPGCEMVEIQPGSPATFEYGPQHVRWKFNIISTQMVRVKDPTEN
ncbi:MAG: hypothetical protein JSU06_06625 [Actinobacteria bacterium]|nr:hypothetical protein [Actinomycetota bacterium]